MTDFYKILKSETKKDTSNNVFIGLEDTNINNEYIEEKTPKFGFNVYKDDM